MIDLRNCKELVFRHTRADDMDVVMNMYLHSKGIMRASGNMKQWAGEYPGWEHLRSDMDRNVSYVIEQDGRLVATFAFIIGEDPTYAKIVGGAWPENTPSLYGTVHRIACAEEVSGVLAVLLNWCFTQINCVRVDTHADNGIMRHLLEKEEFAYCGIIYVADGTPRMAYQKWKKQGL